MKAKQILVGCFLGFLSVASAFAAADDWMADLSREPRGDFPELRPGRAVFAFGWSGITAGTAEVQFSRDGSGSAILKGTGHSVGLARVLWRFDVDYRSTVHSDTLRPDRTHQDENARGKRIITDLIFSENGVERTRVENNRPTSHQQFAFENLNDLFSALLYLRSQPMQLNNVYRLAVYPASSTYLATATVLGREKISVHAGKFDAIKLDLKVQRIAKKDRLKPYKKLKRATVWVSDDQDRMLLRVEGQIFIGAVTAELQTLSFD